MFDPDRLARAIAATFERRWTPIPMAPPDALTVEFAADAAKLDQWRAFIADLEIEPLELAVVVSDLEAFLTPHMALARDRRVLLVGALSDDVIAEIEAAKYGEEAQ